VGSSVDFGITIVRCYKCRSRICPNAKNLESELVVSSCPANTASIVPTIRDLQSDGSSGWLVGCFSSQN